MMRVGKFLLCATLIVAAIDTCAAWQTPQGSPGTQRTAAENLYLQLGQVRLDPARTYRVREAAFNRAAFHITLDDGTIAFTQDVAGHVTGAFFEGDGEVLLVPPDQVERASMALFTGAAILEERFVTAYFRFNDDTFAELQPYLRPVQDAQTFVNQWNPTAENLAAVDALRLLLSFSRFLPAAGPVPSVTPGSVEDRMLHVRLQGRKLGTFDLYYDSEATEQIWAGQLRTVDGDSFYDVWASFSPSRGGRQEEAVNGLTGEEGKTGQINVSHYKLISRVRPPTEMSAEAWLDVEVRQGGQRAVLFELSRFLQIKQVEADGKPLEFIHNPAVEGTQRARRGNDLVAVVFPDFLRSGDKIRLHFVYGGEVLSEAGGGLLYVGARGTWYPNRGLAMADFDLEFHYPPGWTLIATGKRDESVVAASPEEQVSHWVSERPLPLAGFNLGKYSRVTTAAGRVTVEAFAASGVEKTFPRGDVHSLEAPTTNPSPARNAMPVAGKAAEAINFYSDRYGPYPYSNLALTQIPGALSQGWPGLIFLSGISFLTPAEKLQLHMSPVEKTLSDMVIGHETAHQWWGDLVVWSGYRDQWIVEALANYSSLMMLESGDPAQFRAVLDKFRDDLLAKNKEDVPLMDAGPVTLGTRLTCSHFPNGYEAISYGRGTWLFHMLRTMMRDGDRKQADRRGPGSGDATNDAFLRALLRIRNRYQGKSITTRELLQAFAEDLPPSLSYEGKKSLDWFYRGWVNGTSVPRFELQGVKFTDKAGSTVVSGSIVQKQAAKDLVTPVPVFAVVAGHNVFLGRVFVDEASTAFRLNAPSGTRKVLLDPEQTLLTQGR